MTEHAVMTVTVFADLAACDVIWNPQYVGVVDVVYWSLQ
jgi:hypothetical protein